MLSDERIAEIVEDIYCSEGTRAEIEYSIRAALAEAAKSVPEGYVMVPVEPTQEMLKAGERGIGVSSYVRKGMTIREYCFSKSGWDAMLAAAFYLARTQLELEGRKPAVYNPKDLPLAELPVIYGFNNGGPSDFLSAILLAQDGTFLGSHICSHEGYMPGDLGILEGTRPDRHEDFRKHYPDGYQMEFVGIQNIREHKGLMAAIALAEAKGE